LVLLRGMKMNAYGKTAGHDDISRASSAHQSTGAKTPSNILLAGKFLSLIHLPWKSLIRGFALGQITLILSG
jgi:hypothetical protein